MSNAIKDNDLSEVRYTTKDYQETQVTDTTRTKLTKAWAVAKSALSPHTLKRYQPAVKFQSHFCSAPLVT